MKDNFDIPNSLNPSHKNKIRMKSIKKIIIITIISISILAVISFFTYQYIAPFGTKIIYQFNADKDIDKVSKILGAEQAGNIENNAVNSLIVPRQIIKTNQVTFNLKLLTKQIDGVWANLKFKGNPKEIKLGIKGDTKDNYDYKPLFQADIEIRKSFEKTDNNILFWQKDKTFENFKQFINDPPVGKLTASYNFDPTDLYKLTLASHPSSENHQVIINKLLRGSHSFFVKVDNNELNLTIEKQDRNGYAGQDEMQIEILKGNKKIFTKKIPDDGIEDASNLKLSPQKENINIKNIESGIYLVKLIDKTPNYDININNIKVNQSKISFLPPILIIDEDPVNLWTDCDLIKVYTSHKTSFQTILIDNKDNLDIKEVNKIYTNKLNEDSATSSASVLHSLQLPKNDLSIDGDGVFSFSKEAFFDPGIIKMVDLDKVKNTDDIDYIIADYTKVKKNGEWNTAQVYFNPKTIKINGDKLYFSLESPGLAEKNGEITIDSLEVTVEKPGWFNDNSKSKDSSSAETPADKLAEKKEKEEKVNIDNLPIDQKIIQLIKDGWNSIVSFFKNIWPFGTKEPVIEKKKISPTSTPKPTPISEADFKTDMTFKVLNASGTVGEAGKFADKLKDEGFGDDIEVGNSALQTDTEIQYKKEKKNKSQEKIVKKITALLEEEYKSVKENTTASESGHLTIILGTNKIASTTPSASGSAATTPTVTPKATPIVSATPTLTPTPTPVP